MGEINYEVLEYPVKEILADEFFNCRGHITPFDVKTLAEDISQSGLQTPIVIQHHSQDGFKYRVVAGHRRFTAIKMILGWEKIPAMLRDMDDETAILLNLTENIQREDLNILQEAKAIARILHMSREEVAKRVGKSGGWVEVRKMLLKMPEAIQQEAGAGILTQGNIRELYTMHTHGDHDGMIKYVHRVKMQRETGNKSIVTRRVKNNTQRRKRDASEVVACSELIASIFGYGLTTRALAWSAGNISDKDLFDTICEYAQSAGIDYTPPEDRLIIQDEVTNEVPAMQ